MKILIGQGVEDVRFGMLESEIRLTLGDPDRVWEAEEVRHLVYNDEHLDLWVNQGEEKRLEWFSTTNPKLTISGRALIGERESETLDFLRRELKSENVEFEEFETFKSVTFSDHWLELHFEYDRLTTVNLGVLFDGDDEPVWPTP